MQIDALPLNGLYAVTFNSAVDHRGFLAKPFDAEPFRAAGIEAYWQQIILSQTERRNTVKGLHVQRPPYCEAKLIAPVRGRVYWVSVDLRGDSPDFGTWHAVTLDADRPRALYAARGFGHGCLTLTDDSLLLIAADNHYSEQHGVGIAWRDPELAIDWPLLDDAPVIKQEHAENPDFASFRSRYGGL